MLLAGLLTFSHFLRYPQANWALVVPIPGWVVCVRSRTLWVSPTDSPVRLGVSTATATPLPRCFQSEVLRLYFPTLEPWVVWSVLLPSCSSQFICMQTWDHPLFQPLPCHKSSLPRCPSLPLPLVWMNVSSLNPWLFGFYTIWFSGSSGYFLFLNLLLSFFWLCEEAQCIYLCLHIGQKS